MRATAIAPSNIAFIKYWGNLDQELRLPYNASLSMTLDACTTTTTVAFEAGLEGDVVDVDGRALDATGTARVTAQLDRVRALSGIAQHARVTSANAFPMGTGIASSASAFAALTLAATRAAGLDLAERELSALARCGSGSAARSVPGGFVLWHAAPTHEGSFAESLAPPEHWDLRDIVAVVSRAHKAVGSTSGHELATTSPFFAPRLFGLHARLDAVRNAVLARDLAALGPLVEAEALELHAVAMTSQPPLRYWAPATIALLDCVVRWRADGLPAYFTLDAGPNVHLLCEGAHADELERLVRALPEVVDAYHNRPSVGAHPVAAP